MMGTHDFAEMPFVMDKYAKDIPLNVEKGLRIIAQTGYDTVVDATPVLTGKAVSNWNPSLGAPNSAVHGTRGTGARAEMKAVAGAVLRGLTLQTPFFVTNNVPYIGYLENGSRTTSPHHMSHRGVQSMERTAKSMRFLRQL